MIQVEVSCTCGRLVEPRTCHEFQQAVSSIVQQKVRRGEEVNLAKDLSQVRQHVLRNVAYFLSVGNVYCYLTLKGMKMVTMGMAVWFNCYLPFFQTSCITKAVTIF